MPNDKIIKLAEAMASTEFQIERFDFNCESVLSYGDVELILSLPTASYEPLQ
jgi:hypothetical protein